MLWRREWEAPAEEDVGWDLKDGVGRVASNGLYYVILRVEVGGRIEEHRTKVLILR
jgi:hypothetical protein